MALLSGPPRDILGYIDGPLALPYLSSGFRKLGWILLFLCPFLALTYMVKPSRRSACLMIAAFALWHMSGCMALEIYSAV